MRHPDVSQSQIVFAYAGDLWIVDKAGGRASQLTSAEGEESHPKFSPDGRLIAFTAPYADGNEDIYILPVEGGPPKRITHHPAYDRLLDWAPDGQSLIFATDMTSERARYNQIYRVSRNGGLPQRLPMPYGEMAALSPDGAAIAYSYLKDFQNQPDVNREAWKRYRGGRAPDIWYYNFNTKQSRRLTNNSSPDSSPMWNEYGFFFSSEREGSRTNIWSLDVDSGEARRLTNFADDDVTRPSIGPSDIVFEHSGRLYLLALASGDVAPVSIEVATSQLSMAPSLLRAGGDIQSADLSSDSEVAIFSARGDIVTIEVKSGITKIHGAASLHADRYPSLSPDGRSIAYMSDASGEYQLHIRDLQTGAVRQVTNFSERFRYKPFWSPDSKQIAFVDSAQELHLLDVKSGRSQVIDQTNWRDHFGLDAFAVSWSPDSRWLAWSRGVVNWNQAIFVYDVAARKRVQLTSGYYSDASPVFDSTGNYLFMLSQRTLAPVFADIDFNWAYANSTNVTVAALRAGAPSALDPLAEKPAKQSSVRIDAVGFESRIELLPTPAGNYSALFQDDGRAVFLRQANAGAEGIEATIGVVGADFNTVETVISGVDELIAVKAGKALVRKGEERHMIDVKPGASLGAPLPTADIAVPYDRVAENRQIINDAWRFQRDFFYDPGLHGVDWAAVRDSYLALAPFAATASDLSFLLREQAGELSAGHVWAVAKPRERYSYRNTGLLGAEFEQENGGYRIAKIYDAGARRNEYRSPLAAAGVNVKVGEYLLAVNGAPLNLSADPWAALEGLAERRVELTVGPRPDFSGSRKVVVRTLSDESKLRELAWVEDNRRKVEEVSNGEIGYIYVPDTALNGQNELMRQYRAQFKKKGLVIDERFNSGGALGDRLVELLNRPPLVYFNVRSGPDYPLPEISHYGPKALITNGWSYSGGDGFPLLFRAAGVGPLIGEPTWGGLIGPAMSVPFVSGGRVAAPPQRVYTTEGEWAGPDGVEPDIRVENDPGLMMEGRDPQLERTVEYVRDHLADYPPHRRPPYQSEQAHEEQAN